MSFEKCVSGVSDSAADILKAFKLLKNKKMVLPLKNLACFNHALETSLIDLEAFFNEILIVMNKICSYFCTSGRINMISTLNGNIKYNNKFVRYLSYSRALDTTRWSAKYNSCKNFINNLPLFHRYTVKILYQIRGSSSKEEKKEFKTLEELKESIFEYNFLYKTFLFMDISAKKNVLEKVFEDINIGVSRKYEEINYFISYLELLKDEFVVESRLYEFVQKMNSTGNIFKYMSKTREGQWEEEEVDISPNESNEIVNQEFCDCVSKVKLELLERIDTNDTVISRIEILTIKYLKKVYDLNEENINELGNEQLKVLVYKLNFNVY